MKKVLKSKTVIYILALVVLIGASGISVKAMTENRAANIKSKGIIDYDNGTTVIDASDLVYLANEIDALEDTYKSETVDALNQMGTYFQLDGATTHNLEESTLASSDANILPFSSITNGILASQSIPEQIYEGILPGEDNATSGTIFAATADKLSLGAAAWVDGKLIVGTGEDNSSYYQIGYAKGIADGIDNAHINFTYHTHTEACNPHTATCYHNYVERGSVNQWVASKDGVGHTINLNVYTATGSICHVSNSCTQDYDRHSSYVDKVPGCPNSNWNHQVTQYDCGFEEGEMESATIVFDKN